MSIYQVATNKIGDGFSFTPFYNPELSFLPVLAGASIVATNFLGFDAVATFAEETENPKEVLPLAIFFIALIGGILFILISYMLASVFPEYIAYSNPETGSEEIVYALGGNVLSFFLVSAITVGAIGENLAAQSTGARLLYAMGRDSVLPKWFFGKLHKKYKTPVNNILLISVFSLTSFFIDMDIGFSLINCGALFAFTFVNLSVIFCYFVKKKKRDVKGTIMYLILPLIGACFTFGIWLNLSTQLSHR